MQSYDAATRRAQVLPALRTILTDQTRESKPIILDVPVLHPQAGGYILHTPITAGDTVMLVFSQRGLTEFKESLAESDPDPFGMMSLKDAVAIPGFGSTADVSLPATDELVLQDIGGRTHVRISSDTIIVKTPNHVEVEGATTAKVKAPEITLEGNLTVTGTVTSQGQVNAQAGVDVRGDVDVTGTVDANTDVRAGTVRLKTHVHTGVSSGAAVSGPPRP